MNCSSLKDDIEIARVIDHLSTENIITSSFLTGIQIDQIATQEERNRVGQLLLEVTLKQLFEWDLV